MQEYEDLKVLVTEIENDVNKAEGGNKAAGTRVRKQMQQIKQAAQEVRNRILEIRSVPISVDASHLIEKLPLNPCQARCFARDVESRPVDESGFLLLRLRHRLFERQYSISGTIHCLNLGCVYSDSLPAG